MSCAQPCDGCDQTCADRPLVDIEEFQALKAKLLAREAELKEIKLKFEGLSLESTNGDKTKKNPTKPRLRSAEWFGRPDDIDMRILYSERYQNMGLTKEELLAGKPIIGIAQSGSDIAACNRHHLQLAKRVRDGIRSAGGIPFEFPTHPIQETSRRPTATLDRNLAAISLVEILTAYPFDGVVLLTGCDKTTPAFLIAAAQVNIPTICMNVGPMLNGWAQNDRIGSGSVLFKGRKLFAAGTIDEDQFMDMVTAGAPSPGHCNTMGTALTMNCLAEVLGMALPGSAAIPAPYRERGQMAYQTGKRIVELVHEDIRPRDIMTVGAFNNAIVANTALGGSTNAPVHLMAIAQHLGLHEQHTLDDWDRLGFHVPLIVNMQPAGEMLSEEFHRAGSTLAVIAELLTAGLLPDPEARNVNGKTISENCANAHSWDTHTIRTVAKPLKKNAGFLHLRGNLFDSAIMKTSVIRNEFRQKFLEDPNDPNAFECPVAVFNGTEDYRSRIEEAPVDERTILIMRGVGPLGFPGAAEVVNMHSPAHLLRRGLARDLPCIGDGRQSGTSDAPSILHASPEAADGGNLAIVRDGDRVRVDLGKRLVTLKLSDEEIQQRWKELRAAGGFPVPATQTPWQDLHRREVGPLSHGMVMKNGVKYQDIVGKDLAPRDAF
ncbi:dihydroxy-acid dehydratase [Xylariales sp. PMI_506]|nr:dihydroxy-acid dehydratase [Xylariales sp. PMI_506]